MRFGPVPLAKAEGTVLAHSMMARRRPYEAGQSYRIAKGTVLGVHQIEDLGAAGHDQIIVADLDPSDAHEDAAATALAQAIVPDPFGQNIRLSGAGTGRVNLYAAAPGVVRVEAQQVLAINSVDPMISLATVTDCHRVDAEGMIATIKIISYAVPQEDLERATLQAARAVQVLPSIYDSVTLIETTVTPDDPSPKGRNAMQGRLDRMNTRLTSRVIVPHREAPIAQALKDAPGQVLLVLTGSATSDPRDVAPQALRLAGGEVTRFGMPVDPGNLLFLGKLGSKPVIGLPGCVRSPALNGADWVLERILCGIPVTSESIALMGVGGLLKEIPTRPHPRAGT